ncbi:MAG TPA: T9SS type A sorting domain-containing protein, partial [Flavobacteriales bacterium]|nr:T9SS type A sorting domain-containing protein [Flavobacteriales bacterium]
FSGTDVYRKQLGTTSIQDLSSLAQFSVAPNPASDQVRLLNIDPAGTEYRVVNALGATVGQGRLPMDRTIHLGGLEPGVYHISLLKGGKPVGVQRVVKS